MLLAGGTPTRVAARRRGRRRWHAAAAGKHDGIFQEGDVGGEEGVLSTAAGTKKELAPAPESAYLARLLRGTEGLVYPIERRGMYGEDASRRAARDGRRQQRGREGEDSRFVVVVVALAAAAWGGAAAARGGLRAALEG